ncbi:MAG: AAA family ATPase [Desulfobacterales bacterium]|nr:AAA family ATPase [Desulfobacterales bacterium]
MGAQGSRAFLSRQAQILAAKQHLGAPKCCKSWLGLDMAVSVASGTSCLGRFPVEKTGPTLVFLAEDAIESVRTRIEALCKQRKIDIDRLDLFVNLESKDAYFLILGSESLLFRSAKILFRHCVKASPQKIAAR